MQNNADLSWVKEIKNTPEEKEVNELLRNGWKLIAITPTTLFCPGIQVCETYNIYILGR